MTEFKVGDKVKCIDTEGVDFLSVDSLYTVYNIISAWEGGKSFLYLEDTNGKRAGGFYPYRFELVESEFKPEYFSALNEREAEKHIGKTMEFANRSEIQQNVWTKLTFMSFVNPNELKDYSFKSNTNGCTAWHFMRTCPETFKDTGLIEALKKSIQQWELMLSTGKTKEECYTFLGGERIRWSCFLCDYCEYNHDYTYRKYCCAKCINWGGYENCYYRGTSDHTVFTKWGNNKSPENTLAILDHLKSEMERLTKQTNHICR